MTAEQICKTEKMSGAKIFLECLRKEGVDKIFGYPGGVILHIYDELPPERSCIRARDQGLPCSVQCRQDIQAHKDTADQHASFRFLVNDVQRRRAS